MASVSLLSTKFYIPRVRPNAVARPHLTEKLLAGLSYPGSFALLSGPAGFGKTSVLSEFVAQLRQPAAWVSLDNGDNDPIRFWTYLIAACQSVKQGIGESALAALHAPQALSDDAIPILLINDLARLDSDVVLILDDYHAIQNQTIHAAFSFLLDHLPSRLHLVLSTRIDPPWPLARFRARNQLIELRAAELRFTTEEAAAFLNRMMGLNLSAEDVAALEARTEGWVAGLQLAAIAAKAIEVRQSSSSLATTVHSDIAGFVESFTGSHVYVAEYLVEEVLQRQPEYMQTFLIQTSILESLSAKLCEAVTGRQDGQAVLTALHRANIFVLPLDDEGQWFRYHHLFADLLQARLRQAVPAEAIAALHQRASRWYEESGMVSEAVHHALAAADFEMAVRLIESHAVEMLVQGYAKTVEDWLNAIPPELRLPNPRANLAFAWTHVFRSAYGKAAPHVARLQTMFADPQMARADPSLKAEWLALQAYLSISQGKSAETVALANQALEIAPEEDGYVRSLAYNALGSAFLLKDDYARAVDVYQKAILHGRESGNFIVEMLGIAILIQITLQHGQFHFAFNVASEGISRVEKVGAKSPISAVVYGALGQIYYQWRQIEQAHSYYQLAIQLSNQGGYSDAEIGYIVTVSRLLQAEGNLEAAALETQKAVERMQTLAPAWTREEVASQQVRIFLAQDRFAAAETVLDDLLNKQRQRFSINDLTAGHPLQVSFRETTTYAIGQLYNSALRVLLYQARSRQELASLRRGIELADDLIAGAIQRQYLPIALEGILLRAQLHAAIGDERASLADVARAVELAEPEGFISIFIEEGLPVAGPLSALLQQNRLGETLSDYVKRILAAFPCQPSSNAAPGGQPARKESATIVTADLLQPLSRRELEILRLICEGCSNQEIAEQLVLSLHTVKKHSSNIFNKLGVNSRTQAIARARQLKLL